MLPEEVSRDRIHDGVDHREIQGIAFREELDADRKHCAVRSTDRQGPDRTVAKAAGLCLDHAHLVPVKGYAQLFCEASAPLDLPLDRIAAPPGDHPVVARRHRKAR